MFNVFTMNKFEREIAIAEKVYDIAMSEVAYMEAMIDSKLRINMAKSELKVMQESSEELCVGDLAYLFNEAAKEANAQSQSTFAKIKQAVINFITSVWNSIQKVFTKQDTEAFKKLQASKGIYTAPCNIKFFAEKAAEIDSIVSDTNKTSMVAKCAKLALALGVTAGGGFAIKAVYDRFKKESETETKVTGAEAVSIFEKIKGLNIFSKMLNNVKNSEEEAPAENTNAEEGNVEKEKFNLIKIITSFGSKCISFVTGLVGKISGNNVEDEGDKSGKGQNPEPDNGKGQNPEPDNEKGGTDTQGAGSGEDLSALKPGVKAELIAIAKNFGIFDKSKGKKINIDDMKRIIAKLEEKVASGKALKYAGKLELFKKVVQWMDNNHITEFTMDDVYGDVFID